MILYILLHWESSRIRRLAAIVQLWHHRLPIRKGSARRAQAPQQRVAAMGRTGFDKAKTVLRVTSDNFLEVYDFFLFGIYARLIGQIFFPSDEPRGG